jgi:hypothetical protein
MKRILFMFMVCLAFAGCGLGETAVSAAASAGSQVSQATLKTEARVKQQLDEAAAVAAQQRQAAEASSQ